VYKDKTLTCRDCGAEFTFTAGQQQFFAEKGFTNEPARCSDCNAARKQRNDNGAGAKRTSRPQREMFSVNCAACGKNTQVPFKPSNDRPVYCSDCFSAKRR